MWLKQCEFAWGRDCPKNDGDNHVCDRMREWVNGHGGNCQCKCGATYG